MSDRLTAIRSALAARNQEQILAFYHELPPRKQAALLDQIEAVDLSEIDVLIARYVRNRQAVEIPPEIEPAPCYARCGGRGESSYDADAFHEAGEELVREGRVAAFTVAGGQGTRLGWNGPKGTFPATHITGKPLFRIFAEQIAAARAKYRAPIPWYIMTSPINDADTRAFFADNNWFGLAHGSVILFPQGVMPSFEMETGQMLLAEKDQLAVNPDGHGGAFRALYHEGALEDMRARGIEHISYFQVDNPLVRIVDPLFIGLHAAAPDSSAEMSSKMVPKSSADERVGVFARAGDRTMVIEYSDLPAQLAGARDEAGNLRFNAGSIAIHMIGRAFVERLMEGGDFRLPWHRAEKKVPFIDTATGGRIDPPAPNAVKLESFVFDAIPFARSSIILETARAEEFAPIKNPTGVDSVESSREMQNERAARWLEARGVRVPRDKDGRALARIEISPLTASTPQEIPQQMLPASLAPGDEVVL
jgi:UDP-N-acetylglucosamine/UDP-N-acetylgalactosamine diphosphorylase